MKKIYATSLIFIVVILVAMPKIAQANLLENPGFETQGPRDSNDPAGWDVWLGERLNEVTYTGSWSLHSWAWDGEGDGGAWQAISVTPGTKLVFSGHLMSPSEEGVYHKDPLKDGAEAFLEIEWFQGVTKLSSIRSDTLTGASEWALFSVMDIAPADADSARVVAKVVSIDGSSGDVYFDDLEATIMRLY